MKKIIILFTVGLLSGISAFSQGITTFDINFSANPPPHTPGDSFSGATLTNSLFYAILYLDPTTPVSGSIQEFDGTTFTTVFQFTNLVFASYPGGGPAFDYEGSWQLTGTQIQNLLAGQWYAEVAYSGASYSGQITPVPEPSSFTVLLGSLILLPTFIWLRGMIQPATPLEISRS